MIAATYALFRRTASEKNFGPYPWEDTGMRGDDPAELRRRYVAEGGTVDWIEFECRLVSL